MTRNKKIDIRLSDEEYNYIKYISDNMRMSISEYIRQAIRSDSGKANKKNMALHIFNMQSHINNLYQVGVTSETLNLLGLELDKLWLSLN